MATQLRRYQIEEDQIDEFVEWFQRLIPIRASYGLSLDWAYVDRQNNLFAWSTSNEGSQDEFKMIEDTYNASAERALVFKDYQKQVEKMTVSFVEPLDI